jgi:hypothetical protein
MMLLVQLRNLLADVPYVSVTCDTWTRDNTAEPYIGTTVHWISDSWELLSLCADVCFVSGTLIGFRQVHIDSFLCPIWSASC